jgi:hypothetical protein
MMVAILSVGFVSCGGDDELNEQRENNSKTDNSTKYIATTSVKSVELLRSNEHTIENGVESRVTYVEEVKIYEDFNYKYNFLLHNGKLYIRQYTRVEGRWNNYEKNNAGILSVGKISSINDVTNKDVVPGHSAAGHITDTLHETSFGAIAQPNFGYAICFVTENEEIKYIRCYIQDYCLDNAGTLSSITLQYQLY